MPSAPWGDIGRFALADEITADDPLVRQYVAFLEANRLDLAGIELVTDREGRRWTYDVNGTTNYNGAVEEAHGFHGMGAIAALAERALRAA